MRLDVLIHINAHRFSSEIRNKSFLQNISKITKSYHFKNELNAVIKYFLVLNQIKKFNLNYRKCATSISGGHLLSGDGGNSTLLKTDRGVKSSPLDLGVP